MAGYTRKTVGIVAAAAVTFGGCATSTDDQPQPLGPPEVGRGEAGPGNGVGPTRSVYGVPVGWARSTDGARAAAVSAVALTGEVATAGFITRGDMIGALASNRFAPGLAETTERQLAELGEALGETDFLPPSVSWSEIPLTARVVRADRWDARVEVWSVLVVAGPDVGVPRQAWRTVTLDLVWEQDDWKVDGWATKTGPTPALAAGAAVSEGGDVSRVAEWPPASGLPDVEPGDGR